MFTRRTWPSWRMITPLMLWEAFSRMARRTSTRSLGSRALRQREQLLGGRAGGLNQVVLGRTGEMQDLVIAVDHDASQTKPLQQAVLRQLCQREEPGAGPRAAAWPGVVPCCPAPGTAIRPLEPGRCGGKSAIYWRPARTGRFAGQPSRTGPGTGSPPLSERNAKGR